MRGLLLNLLLFKYELWIMKLPLDIPYSCQEHQVHREILGRDNPPPMMWGQIQCWGNNRPLHRLLQVRGI